MFYEKQDTYKVIRDLTYYIGSTGVEVKDSAYGKQDFEIVAFTHNDAKYIRKQLQIENEEIFYLYIYIMIKSDNLNTLEEKLRKIESIIQGGGSVSRRLYFRQKLLLKSVLPMMNNDSVLKSIAKRNVLTTGLISTYPFITSSLIDEKGILYGINMYNNSLIFINRFKLEKYKNSNMCVLGTSGSGKSYFIKLQIFRNRLMNIEQYIIDPEREYKEICENLEGTYIRLGPTSKTTINVLDIRENSLEEGEGYLATKISKLIGFFNLVFGKLDEEENAIIEEQLIEMYNQKGITFNDETLYKNNKFKTSIDMPILEDFYNTLIKNNYKKYAIKLIPFVKGSLNFFNNYTNIEFSNKLVVADIYELGEENLKYGMYLFADLFWDKIKFNREKKKIIYVDEIWRLIGITSNNNVASFIYKIFKTIRKYGGSAVAITQDIMDLFSLDEGGYGRSIINNSSIKVFFSLEEENIRILENYYDFSEKEKIEIKSLKRGESLIFAGKDHVLIEIQASEIEEKIINEKKRNNNNVAE